MNENFEEKHHQNFIEMVSNKRNIGIRGDSAQLVEQHNACSLEFKFKPEQRAQKLKTNAESSALIKTISIIHHNENHDAPGVVRIKFPVYSSQIQCMLQFKLKLVASCQ